MTPQRKQDAAFVVRIYWEWKTASRPRWRGQVIHAQSGQSKHFQDFRVLLTFIKEWSGATGQAEDATSKGESS